MTRLSLVLLLALSTASLPAAAGELAWIEVDGARIPVPPGEHPRLYLRAEHAAQLPATTRQKLEELALL
ncbi:MAG: hypothetical protein JJ992_11535, partial [Planctomycetes bacterium]|nr:hypothetical protein [Planctomycetota bacterium]